MARRFEESAREKMQCIKDLQRVLSSKDSEITQWTSRARQMKTHVDEHETSNGKLKVIVFSVGKKRSRSVLRDVCTTCGVDTKRWKTSCVRSYGR